MHPPTYTRSILSLNGADAASFLQGITTCDVTALRENTLALTAFLSPQGKLLFDAFAWREKNTLFLDCDASSTEALISFLTRYKLRAKITIATTEKILTLLDHHAGRGFPDPRHPDMPKRLYSDTHDYETESLSAAQYHASRIALGIPEAAFDSAGDDVAMDMGYDALGAISFTKGCYVGQEVTARMHYKNIARKAILRVTAHGILPSAQTPITAGPLTLGALRSHTLGEGLALIRLDTWEEAQNAGHPIICGHIPITLHWPEWAQVKHEQWRQGKLAQSQ